ncbi:MAG: TolC family protein [Acidobacteriota bacterium]
MPLDEAKLEMRGPGEVPDIGDDYFVPDPQLREFIRLALAENPEIQVALSRYRAAVQKIPQVTALPDPMITFTKFLRSPETRVGPQVSGATVSQKFPWFGKLDLEGRMAAEEAASLYEAYRAKEREIAARVKVAFYELAFVDQAQRIVEEEKSLLAHYETLAQARYEQGTGLQQAVIKLQAEITQLDDRLQTLRQQRESLVTQLNTLLNRDPATPVPTVRLLEVPAVELDLPRLYALAEEHRHELRAVTAQVAKAERAIQRAKKDYWPDLTFSAGFVNVEGREDLAGVLAPPPDNGKNIFSFAVSLNLPIQREKYDARVVESTELRSAARSEYRRLLNDIEFVIRDQVIRLETLQDQLRLYEEALLVQAEEALRSAEAAYETGRVGILDLLDSERFFLRTKLIRERYRADYWKALATLEQALGTKYPVH